MNIQKWFAPFPQVPPGQYTLGRLLLWVVDCATLIVFAQVFNKYGHYWLDLTGSPANAQLAVVFVGIYLIVVTWAPRRWANVLRVVALAALGGFVYWAAG